MIDTLRALPNRVPLRVTLVSSMLLLVTVALGASGAAGTYMLRRYLVQGVDEQLDQAGKLMVEVYKSYGNEEGSEYLTTYLRAPVSWSSLTLGYVDRNGNGQGLLYTSNNVSQPKLDRLDIAWVRAHAEEPFDARPVNGGRYSWRVMVLPMPDGNISAVVAILLNKVDGTVSRLAFAHVVIGSIVLAVLALVGYGMVRTSLRGLVTAERTAREIAAGDLSRRVPAAHPDTEVGRLATAFNTMISEIEMAFRARERSAAEAHASEARMRRFAADASHELRTPLTAIRGFAELYRQGGGEPAHVIARIEHHATRMSALVEDLLLLARLDQRRPVEQRPVDLLALAADAVQDMAVTGDRSHPVRLIAAANRPPVVIGDELQLRQVIGNLLTNAMQHTPTGTAVTVSVSVGAEVVLAVADEGPGLAPEDASRVFERFFRPDPARTRSTAVGAKSGSGLGLSIVHSIVVAHGGTIILETAPGAGARFEVRLPLAPSDVADEPEPSTVDIDLDISTEPEAG